MNNLGREMSTGLQCCAAQQSYCRDLNGSKQCPRLKYIAINQIHLMAGRNSVNATLWVNIVTGPDVHKRKGLFKHWQMDL
jgi:hypothetical protein